MTHHPKHRCDPARARRLWDPAYRLIPHPLTLVEALGVERDMVVADLGCGPGFFTKPLLEAVGSRGRVVAVDLQAPMFPLLHEHLGSPPNLQTLQADLTATGLPDATLDAAFIAFTLHELSPPPVLTEVRRLLKPTGILLVLEWGDGPCPEREPGRPAGPPADHRLLQPTLERLLTEAGFRVTASGQPLQGCQYWLRATPLPL